MSLTNYELETIINFNKAEKIAYIFTYDKTWQKHLEQKLGLKPIKINGFGGREYKIDKSRIKPPRAKRQLSKITLKRLSKGIPSTPVLRARNTTTPIKTKVKA